MKRLLLIALLFALISAYPAHSQEGYALEKIVDHTFERPVFLTEPDDGTGRLFVVEQTGRVHIIQDGAVLPDPFLDLSGMVSTRGNEQGLLGFAFHPNFAENGYVYANYVYEAGRRGASVIARFRLYDENHAIDSSRVVLLELPQPFRNHNGGMLTFGPDGYLYSSFGDGGRADDPFNNGQNPDTLLGTIIRIDVDGGTPYAIPSDNPFADGEGGAPEVWLWGLRNPWRFSFDRETGAMFIGDVGQHRHEEIDYVPPGESNLNFGWNAFEGVHEYIGTANGETTLPVAEYDHDSGCSVTGGYVYRGSALPELQGAYLFADYCSGIIWSLRQDDTGEWEQAEFMDTDLFIASFGQDAAGELYVLDHAGGGVYKLVRGE